MQELVVHELLTYLLEPTFCLSIINPSWPDYGAASGGGIDSWLPQKFGRSLGSPLDLSVGGKLVFTLRRLRSLRCHGWAYSPDFSIRFRLLGVWQLGGLCDSSWYFNWKLLLWIFNRDLEIGGFNDIRACPLFLFSFFQNSMTRVPDSSYQCNGESSIEVSYRFKDFSVDRSTIS